MERRRDRCYRDYTLSRRYLSNFGLPAVVLATLYVACADPPKKINKGSGGSPGTAGMPVGEAGESESAGSNATGGKGGSSGMGDGGAAGEAGAAEEGGAGGAGGEAGAAPDTACSGFTVGTSMMPVPPTTGVAKPSGAVGGLQVINWAGFKGALSYTFDDALQNQVTRYENINGVGIHVTFYLVNFNLASNPIWEKAVADGHELGNHTQNHCQSSGTQCLGGTFQGVDKELDNNTAFLMAKPGVTGVYSFASPYGDGGWAEPASQRFLLGRGVSDSNGGVLPNDNTNPFTLPCHITNTAEPAVDGLNKISDDVRSKGTWRTILMHSVDDTISDGAYQPIKLADAIDTMTYTKGLGDVWADTVIAIGAYWRAQKTLSTLTPTTVGSDKVYSWTLPAHFPPGHYVRAKVTGGKVKQCGQELTWDDHGYYEINLDAGSVTISP